MQKLHMPDQSLVIESIGGNCPVQAEGIIAGEPFYFRARWQRWSFSVGGRDIIMSPAFRHIEDWPGEPGSAGWMTFEEAISCIGRGAEAYHMFKQEENNDPNA